MIESSDTPVREQLRVMQLMDCAAGHCHSPDGPPIVILRLANGDQMEQAMMLSRYDAERLSVALLIALSSHGDELANRLLVEHFSIEDDPNDVFRREPSDHDPNPIEPGQLQRVAYRRQNQQFVMSDPPNTLAPQTSSREPVTYGAPGNQPIEPSRSGQWSRELTVRKATQIRFTVKYTRGTRTKNRFSVIGGYTDGSAVFILARRRKSGGAREDGVAKLALPLHIHLWSDGSDEWITPDRWQSFLALKDGAEFSLGSAKLCRKMPVAAIAELLSGKVLRSIR